MLLLRNSSLLVILFSPSIEEKSDQKSTIQLNSEFLFFFFFPSFCMSFWGKKKTLILLLDHLGVKGVHSGDIRLQRLKSEIIRWLEFSGERTTKIFKKTLSSVFPSKTL